MHTAPAPQNDPTDSLTALAVSLSHDATVNPDPERRAASASWLGLMKYEDVRAAQNDGPRSPGEDTLFKIRSARLPVIDAFISTADADQLRHVLDGMVLGFDNHAPHPGPGHTSTYRTIRHFADLVADITQDDDDFLRQRAGRLTGTLMHDIEHRLRNWDHTVAERRYLVIQAAMITGLVETADSDQLRDIIAGFVTAMKY